ncbi:MAG: ATP-binding protein [Bacteroidetes bacterium]|nr:ATP-binding protein [Bacteroidota bacterium]
MPKIFVPRLITDEALASFKEFPVLTISGPRQSGKTTLARHLFGGLAYFNLENPDTLELITSDPRAFLNRNSKGAILDEIQKAPELLSYIQTSVDENPECKFILTGSNQFSMLEKITQSMAGRTAILKLLPFCLDEISKVSPDLLAEELIYKGGLPVIYSEGRDPVRTYRNYYETYIERDVRSLINIRDLSLFRKFMRLCAGRTGQIFNASQLANETGVAVNTIKSWISVLETSFIIYMLPPWFDSITKRLIKSPKLYFYDVGLASYLLGIRNENHVQRDPLRGALFENLVMNELIKRYFNSGLSPEVYFYRDKNVNEIDALLNQARKFIPVEIKASETFHGDFLKNLNYIRKIYPNRIIRSILVYAGQEEQENEDISIINYKKLYHKIKP